MAGSPPRVRGKRRGAGAAHSRLGITPACAGKTTRRKLVAIPEGDHPRVCGENESEREAGFRFKGSPPRVRGKPVRRIHRESAKGITPACAGKTLTGGEA